MYALAVSKMRNVTQTERALFVKNYRDDMGVSKKLWRSGLCTMQDINHTRGFLGSLTDMK